MNVRKQQLKNRAAGSLRFRRITGARVALQACYCAAFVLFVLQPITGADEVTTSDEHPQDQFLLAEREQQAMQAAVESVANSVVRIRTIGGLDRVESLLVAQGPTTGLIISADGYIVSSAFNFVQQPSSILVTLPSGEQAPAELVATDHSRMVVVLKVDGVTDLPVPPTAPLDEIEVGNWAIAVGRTFQSDRVNISIGIVSALSRMHDKAIQTDAAVSLANYGGPLIDIRGRVLGIIVPMAPQSTSEVAGVEWYDSGIGFAVPLAPLEQRIERLKQGEDQQKGVIGIGLAPGSPYETPATIASVRPRSPAAAAGLAKGDQIVEVDGQPVETQTDLRMQLGPHYAGDQIAVTIARGDERIERELTLVAPFGAVRHAFLGVLPMRNEKADETDKKAEVADKEGATPLRDPKGIAVRMVYPGSPAEHAGLKPGDRIQRLDDTEIQNISDALDVMNGVAVGAEVSVEIVRDQKRQQLSATTTRLPTDLPPDLPPAYHANDRSDGQQYTAARADKQDKVPPPAAEQPDATAASRGEQTGIVEWKLPEFPNECRLYVPETYQRGARPGVLLWLHAEGQSDTQQLFATWRPFCERYNLILVVPTAADMEHWQQQELEYLGRLLDRAMRSYDVDPRRVVVHGLQGGGAMAYLLGLRRTDVVRGISTSASPLPRAIRPPEADITWRLAILAEVPDRSPVREHVRAGLRKLAAAGHPVTVVSDATDNGQAGHTHHEQLARWIDTLDRF